MAKYHEEEWLEEQLVEKEREASDIAEECGVQKETIFKWREKLHIGKQYGCEICQKEFPTERGRNMHHKTVHQLSTGGFIYVCENCKQDFNSPRAPDDDKAPRFCGQGCYGETLEGKKNPNKNKKRRDKISEGLKTAYSENRKKGGYRKQVIVEETGHTVDSSWEAEVDRLLHRENIEYKYNGKGQDKIYSLGEYTHAPDFILPRTDVDIIIEVKGGIAVHFHEEKTHEIAQRMYDRDDVRYIVYGDVNLECNCHIEYGNESELLKAVRR